MIQGKYVIPLSAVHLSSKSFVTNQTLALKKGEIWYI